MPYILDWRNRFAIPAISSMFNIKSRDECKKVSIYVFAQSHIEQFGVHALTNFTS